MTIAQGASLNQLSFKQQLIIAFGFGIVCFAVISSFVISSISSQTVHKQFVSQGKQITENFAEQSVLSLLYHSTENAQEASKSILSFPDVSSVVIYDKNHTTLFNSQPNSLVNIPSSWSKNGLEYVEMDDMWHFSMPVFSGEWALDESSPFAAQSPEHELIGFVQVCISKESLHAMTREILKSNLLIALSFSVGLLLLLLMITNRLLRPLKQLALNMHQAEQGNIRVRAMLEGSADLLLMEQAFNTMMDELEHRENELVVARDEAIDTAKAKGEFAATVSHELRTPMNGVLGMLQLLQSTELDSKPKEYVDIATNSAQTLLLLIDDILDFSKVESGKMKFHLEDFGIRELVTDVVELLALQSNAKKVMLSVVIDPNLKNIIRGDSGRIRQILLNLAGNAIKFTDQGMVMIRVEQVSASDNLKLKFEVEDTGIGISEEAQKRIFDSFVQADGTTTRTYGGTGLGLTISEQLIMLMGGKLRVKSKIDEGSTFWFTIPMAVASQPSHVLPINDQKLFLLKVLTIGDHKARNKVFSLTLSSWQCIHQQAESFEQAIFMIGESRKKGEFYDLVIVDNPVINPFDINVFGTNDELASMKILVLSDDLSHNTDTTSIISPTIKYIPSVIDSITLRREMQCITSNEVSLENTVATSLDSKSKESIRILVVDDNESDRMLAQFAIEDAGVTKKIFFSNDGEDALNFMKEYDVYKKKEGDLYPPNVVLLDINMPKMNGFEFLEQYEKLNADERYQSLVVLMLTSSHSDEDKARAEKYDAVKGFITKPITEERIAEIVAGL